MSDVFEKFNQVNLIVSPEDVFDYLGTDLAKDDGMKMTYSCPYHADDSPSLLVDKSTGMYNCFACECGGYGGYSCAKYYLEHQNNNKPTVMMVINFLCEVNPQVEQFKYLFAVKVRREYDRDLNKRRDFSNRLRLHEPTVTLNVKKRSLNDKQVGMYIDAIMTDMPEEFILQTLGVVTKEKQEQGSDEFLALMGALE